MFRGIATSDWHLMGMTKVLGANASKIQLNEIRKIYEYAVSNGIKHVVSPGDITDNPNMDDSTFIQLLQFLLEWDSKVKTYYLVGNHDWEHRDKSSLDVLKVLAENGVFKNFRIFYQPKIIPIDGVLCAFLPFPHLDVPKSKKFPELGRLIFAHIEVQGAIGDNGRPLKTGHLDKLKYTDKDYVISGHIHQHQILKQKRFTYIGSPYQKNFGESLPKGFIEFQAKNTNEGLKVKTEFVDNHPSFILKNVVIKEQSDWNLLEKDTTIKYKIHVDKNSDVVIPKNIMTDFPNIVHLSGFDSTKVKNADTIKVSDIPKINMKTGLSMLLKKEGFSKSQIKMAREMVQEAISSL